MDTAVLDLPGCEKATGIQCEELPSGRYPSRDQASTFCPSFSCLYWKLSIILQALKNCT